MLALQPKVIMRALGRVYCVDQLVLVILTLPGSQCIASKTIDDENTSERVVNNSLNRLIIRRAHSTSITPDHPPSTLSLKPSLSSLMSDFSAGHFISLLRLKLYIHSQACCYLFAGQ